nr:MAG: putative RNA-dependent RNA polymerase [Betapartitivirus sp.]
MPIFNSVRNYLAERLARVKSEWQIFQSSGNDPSTILETIQDSDYRRMHTHRFIDPHHEERYQMFQSEYKQILSALETETLHSYQPFELRKPRDPDAFIPENRHPAPGIKLVPYEYHRGHIIHANPETSRPLAPDNETDAAESYLPGDIDFGSDPDPLILTLVTRKYPEYLPYLAQYCRPAGTTDGTFRDFNKAQIPSDPIPDDRREQIFSHIFHFLDCTPYLPLHFVDTQYAKLPLVTGTGYHNRFSYKQRAQAKYSRPDEYSDRPTSKGYFYNATYENARTLIHKIKETGMPFNLAFAPENEDLSDDQILDLVQRYDQFFLDYPTILFTRVHISKRDGTLKVRPVYAVDDLFIIIETMLTFPLLVQARKPSCCIMYGLETIRGSNAYLDSLARNFSTFFTIDWSGYDQHLPRVITDLFYTHFLRRLIVINHGYAPTWEYPEYPDLTEHSMYRKMDNLLHFLHLWYNNLVYLNVDGYAYWRTFAGVPSGLYNTQYLDSFGNLFLLIDGMLEYGFSNAEIRQLTLFVLGDDNSGMTNWSLPRLHDFIRFLEKYALTRYNMVLSHTKSVITRLRSRIETLGYQCNNGLPKRDIGKLVAQLCYPEHGMKYHTMSMRAIGIAYASCAIDRTFYTFAHDLFHTFLPYHQPDLRYFLALQRQLSITDQVILELDIEHPTFPSFEQIRLLISAYQGPLEYKPKWNYAHFILGPDVCPPDSKTMADYELEHNLRFRPAPTFSHD